MAVNWIIFYEPMDHYNYAGRRIHALQSKEKAIVFFILVAFLVLQPLQLVITNAAGGYGTWSSPYSVSQAISSQNGSIKTVEGYIVGQPTSTSTVITSHFPNDYALALADDPSESNTAEMIYVQIPSSFNGRKAESNRDTYRLLCSCRTKKQYGL